MKLLFIPFSVAAGLIAGFVGKKLFEEVWGLVDDQDPPESEHRDATWPKVLAAAALEGAVFRATKVAADRGARTAFLSVTGSWPGEQGPDKH
jgi:hypothetical protein